LGAAAIALGSGIWSMHFVAMLAFNVPGMEVRYDAGLTIISLLIALVFTAAGFALSYSKVRDIPRILVGGILMGSGVVAMHYIGMAAMRMSARLQYDPIWVAVSVVIAIGAATVAMALAARDHSAGRRAIAGIAMGLAISGMHFTGMHAARMTSFGHGGMRVAATGIDPGMLAMLITTFTLLILCIALGAVRLERILDGYARREARIALRLRVADILRRESTDDGLQEVAALMGSHFQVARTGYGRLDSSEDTFDYEICWTDGSVPPLLGRFPAAAFGPKIVRHLASGMTVAVDDLLAAELSDEPLTRATAREVDTRAILVVPFTRNGRLRTIVYLNDRAPRTWHAQDVAFMEEIAERTRLVMDKSEAERALREVNANLEARVEARTRELQLTQEALLQSQKMEAVGQLVSGLAHDFNNVLGGITGAFDVIQRRSRDPEQVQRFAQAGLQAAERGTKLTRQLLVFARSQQIELEPLYLCDIIENLSEILRRTLGPMIDLELDLNPTPVPVLADPTQVEMAVLNLAINARDAMPEGGSLHIATAVQSVSGSPEIAEGTYVELTVSDTGTGMDEATARRAMEPFFTTKPVGKGTGLGLAQIFGSARQAGGTVTLKSALGVGTTVRILLPATDRQPKKFISRQIQSNARFKAGTNILLVDDDRDLRNLLAGALSMEGAKVREAAEGQTALALLDAEVPDIVIIDFAMPGMNGAELARNIWKRWPSVPMLLISGFADWAAIEEVAGGKLPVLRKPFHISQFLDALHACVGGR